MRLSSPESDYEALRRVLLGQEPGERGSRAAFLLCGIAAFATIWIHRYPVGIDLPQHAVLFQLWHSILRGPIEFRELYHIEWFTPYLLTYAIGGTLAGIAGGLFATKCMLTLGVFGTVLMMRRWLVSIGGDKRLALFGFVIAFGYAYIWGFLSNVLALPVFFAYLAQFELQGEAPDLRAILATAAVGLALFFTHGITFGVAMLCTGLQLFRRRFPFIAFRNALHMIPIVIVLGIWVLTHRTPIASTKPIWFLDFDRLVSLWSGLFWPFADARWEHLGLAAMTVFLISARPRFVFESRRWTPFLVALGCFLVLPESVAATWLVGNRCLLFVQAFAPGTIKPRRTGVMGKAFPYVSGALVLAALVLLNVRTAAHNRELRGLRELSKLVEPNSDIQNVTAVFGHVGTTFGWNEIGQTPGFVVAERGGTLDNDSARYFHVPVQRRAGPWLTRYRYAFARGTRAEVEAYINPRFDHPRLLGQKDDWFLFEQAPLRAGDVEALRSVQSAGELRANASVSQAPLSIGGQKFVTGFGTHTSSLIRVRMLHPARVFEGGYGIDDEGSKTARARFRIRDDKGHVLLFSESVSWGAVHRFSVPLEGQRELVLEVLDEGDITGGHVDWVDLTAK